MTSIYLSFYDHSLSWVLFMCLTYFCDSPCCGRQCLSFVGLFPNSPNYFASTFATTISDVHAVPVMATTKVGVERTPPKENSIYLLMGRNYVCNVPKPISTIMPKHQKEENKIVAKIQTTLCK